MSAVEQCAAIVASGGSITLGGVYIYVCNKDWKKNSTTSAFKKANDIFGGLIFIAAGAMTGTINMEPKYPNAVSVQTQTPQPQFKL